MATLKSAYDFLEADEKTALDYVDILLPDNLEDQLSEKLDNPFYMVDGCYDPSSDTDMSTLKSAIDEMLNNYFGKGRFPVKTDVVAGGGSVFRFGPTVLRPIAKDLEMKYVTSDGLTLSGQPQYQLESQNRLLKLEDCLPSRKITRKELQDLYFRNTNMYHGIPSYINKLVTSGNGVYGSILDPKGSTRSGFPTSAPVDSSLSVKTIMFPLGIMRNNNKGNGPDKYGSTRSYFKLIARPYNNMVGEKHSDIGNSDILLNGITSKTVRIKLKEVYGTASDIFQESGGDVDVDLALDSIKKIFPEGAGCVIGHIEEKLSFAFASVYRSTDIPAQVHSYTIVQPYIYMDILVPTGTEIPSSKDLVITTGSTAIDIWAGLDSLSPFGGALSGPETVASSNSNNVGQLTVPTDDNQFGQALSGNHSILRSRAYENLGYKSRTGPYPSSSFCETVCKITLEQIGDTHTVMVFVTYNPYDIITSTHFKNGNEWPITEGVLDANKLRIADNRINLSSDIFDIFGIDLRIELDE